ncbi:MAG: nucleotidyltransferase family protein [Candidatus Omnitrophica bacterium]|nr:nucleotidyltransferase family protein [Candidatus Omnitrophota bacterium]
MISCLVLSAGLSERFGSPKPLAPFKGTTVIGHILKTLLETSCDEIIVVLGASSHIIFPTLFNHTRIRVVYNKDYNFGQTSSVQMGWRSLSENVSGVMILPVDCPLLQASSIEKMIQCFNEKNPEILIPTFNHRKGHPPIFKADLKEEVLGLPFNLGLNSLFSAHPPQTIEIDDIGVIKSFNTPEELEIISRL